MKAGDGTRTRDPLFTRQALYQLSYSGVPGPRAGATHCNEGIDRGVWEV